MVEFIFNQPDNTLNCILNGRIGTDVNVGFSGSLSDKIAEIRNTDTGNLKVCFDLKNVSFISSSFIRTCIATSRQIETGNFSIINANPDIKKTFKIAGLDGVLNVS